MNLWAILICMLLLTACETRRDVSHKSRHLTEYVVGATYRTRVKLAVRDFDGEPFLCLSHPSDPVDGLRAGPNFIGAVPAGTLLTITKVELHKKTLVGHFLNVYGRCAEGPVTKQPVQIFFGPLSPGGYILRRNMDPNILEVVSMPRQP